MTPADIVRRIKEQGLPGPPDGSRSYSSAGYAVIARIIELETDMDFASAMDMLVFQPLGMTATLHADSRQVIPGRASPYYFGPRGTVVNAPLKDLSFLAGGGSLWSTAEDVLRFARAYLDRRLLSHASWDEFHTLGWAQSDPVRWSGSTNGWFCFLDLYQSQDMVVVYLGNNGMGAVNQLRRIIPKLVGGESYEPARPAPPSVLQDTTGWSSLAGRYVGADDEEVTITVEKGALWLNGSCLRAIGDSRFFNPFHWVEIDFTVEDGRSRELRILIPGHTRVYRRS